MIVVPYKRGTTVTIGGVFPLAPSDAYSVVARFRDPRSKAEATDWGFVVEAFERVGLSTNPDAVAAMSDTPGLVLHDYRLRATAPATATMLWPAPLDPQRNVDLVGSFYVTDAGGNVQSIPFDNLALRGSFS